MGRPKVFIDFHDVKRFALSGRMAWCGEDKSTVYAFLEVDLGFQIVKVYFDTFEELQATCDVYGIPCIDDREEGVE